MPNRSHHYFPCDLQLSEKARTLLDFEKIWAPFRQRRYPSIIYYRRLAAAAQDSPAFSGYAVTAAQLNLYSTLLKIFRYLVDTVADDTSAELLSDALSRAGIPPDGVEASESCTDFERYFPPSAPLPSMPASDLRHIILREMLLLRLASENRALDSFRPLLDDSELAASSAPYQPVTSAVERSLAAGPCIPGLDLPLLEALRAPLTESPDSLAGQLGYIKETWGALLPAYLFEEVLTAFDILEEENRLWSDGGSGPDHVLRFGTTGGDEEAAPGWGGDPAHVAGYDQPEYEAFSPDADWMSNVVLMAKMTHVWLDQLSRIYARPIHRLDQIPDAELDTLASRGFTGLWLIGLWERSPASQRIKELCGNPEAHASAYSLYDYTIAGDLGGEPAFMNLKERAWKRGIRLASDMVPNHTGIYSRWVVEHPDWFIQTDYPPFPTYQYNGEDLSRDPAVTIQIDDGYWTKHDAAVAFRMIDRRDGRMRYIYHGNDGTSIPWNDTAQLNYLIPEVREAVMNTILHVARLTPIIRFDAAMTLAKKHYQRLWFPQRGLGGGIPSRAEHAMGRDEFDAVFPVEFWREVVDRVAKETPGTLLLAEAFWMMEGYFVRTLGMHRVYNSAFMNMLKKEENQKYRETVKNVLEFNPEILKRFVNFMNNPDEKTAVEQFGTQGKYFGACVLMSTMPGLPMFGHGQLEGFKEKYGMEYRRAYWDEQVDQGLLQGHAHWIFPLLKRRWLFSGSENFAFYNFRCADGGVDENVFAYSNRAGEHRALVLYNNRYGHTAGWLNDSTAVAARRPDGTEYLDISSLGHAMGIPADPGSWLAFTDMASGLSYLRNSLELHEKGLYAELGEYEFHVFWDFRELRDSERCNWGNLCSFLQGKGVESLEDELVFLDNRPLVEAFGVLLERISEEIAGSLPLSETLFVMLEEFKEKAAEYPGEFPDTDMLRRSLEALRTPSVCRAAIRKRRTSAVTGKMLPSDPLHRRIATAIAITRSLLITID